MGLDFQVVPVDFTGGLDTRTNPKLRLPGKWDLLTNCVHSKDGSATKRDGVRALVPGVNGHGLATFDDELLSVNGTALTTTALNPSVGGIAVDGQIACLHVEKKEVVRATNAHDQVDCAFGLNLEVYVWRERSILGAATIGVYFCAYDIATRALVQKPTLLSATGNAPRVVNVGDAFMFFWTQGVGIDLYAAVYSPTTGVGPATNLAIAVGTAVFEGFDAVGYGFDGVTNFVFTGAVSYVFDDGVTSVRCSQVTYNEVTLVPAVMSTRNLFTEISIPAAMICGLGMSVIGGLAGANTYAATVIASPIDLTAPLSGVSGNAVDETWAACLPTLIDGVSPILNAIQATHVAATRYPVAAATTCQVYVDGYADRGGVGGTGIRPLRSYSIMPTGAGVALTVVGSWTLLNSSTNTNAAALQGPFIAGCPFVIGRAAGGLFSNPATLALPVCMTASSANGVIQSGLFLLDGVTGVVIGKAMYGQLASHGYGGVVPSTPQLSNFSGERTGVVTFSVPVLEMGRLNLLDETNMTTSGVASIRVTPNVPMGTIDAGAWAPRRAQHGRATFIANGALSSYDGVEPGEAGFDLFPEGLGIAVTPGAGAWAAGTYEFVFVYEWVDGQGQRHQSAPSPTVQLVVTLNDLLTFRTPTLHLTQHTNVKHVLYGTQPNGTTFNRFGTVASPVEIANDKTLAQSVTAVTAGPPASNELLYSQPFVADTTLPNDAPGPCSVIGIHQNRVWVDLSDKAGAYRFSQQLIDGVGLQFNELLGGQLPGEAGDITGFASMDEIQVILTERKLFRVTGTGPTPSGGYNGYSDPVEIPSDVGCTEPASVLKIPDGVMFRSQKGWYLLTRDLSVRYIGGPIKRWDSDIITSAVLMEDRQEIRISSRHTYDSGFSGALQFCYSYVADTWSVFQVSSLTVALKNCYLAFDAVWWPTLGKHVSIGYYDGINNDTPGVYTDWVGNNATGFAIGMSARSSFLHLTALEGYQRVRWLYLTASSPVAPATALSFRIDFDDLYATQNPPGAPGCYLTDPLTLTALPFANPAAIDLRHKFRRQKCKSVAITINETPVSPGAEGITGFQALALQIGAKRGTNRLPAAQGVP